jgi:RHS repeat-associated protein
MRVLGRATKKVRLGKFIHSERFAFVTRSQLLNASKESASLLRDSTSGALHLNTPRMIQDQNQNTVWRNDNTEPFGDAVPNGDPGNTGDAFDFALRISRYYQDKETGNLYAQQRDAYDPAIGRFPQSDPLGLIAGLNTYLYVEGNPVVKIDPFGLSSVSVPWTPSAPKPIPIFTPILRLLPAVSGPQLLVGTILMCIPTNVAQSSAACSDDPRRERKECQINNDDECLLIRERDEAACKLLSGTRYGPRGVAVCMASAAERYAECLRFGPGGIKTPLHGVDTPL